MMFRGREYLLKIISNEDQIIKNEWIKYYEFEMPVESRGYVAVGIDLAISQKDHADCTAMVVAKVFGRKDKLQIFILPEVVNKKMTSEEIIKHARMIYDYYDDCTLYLEDNGFQSIFVDTLKNYSVKVEGVTSVSDKFSRLSAVSSLVQSGKVFFHKDVSKELIQQLIGFGREKHDDLADAFSLLLGQILKKDNKRECVGIVGKADLLGGGSDADSEAYYRARNFHHQPKPWLGPDIIGGIY